MCWAAVSKIAPEEEVENKDSIMLMNAASANNTIHNNINIENKNDLQLTAENQSFFIKIGLMGVAVVSLLVICFLGYFCCYRKSIRAAELEVSRHQKSLDIDLSRHERTMETDLQKHKMTQQRYTIKGK